MKKIIYAFMAIFIVSSCQKKSPEQLKSEYQSANAATDVVVQIDSIPPIFKDTSDLPGKKRTVSTGSTERQLISTGYDYSGRVQVSIWAEYTDGVHNHVEVSVDPDFVLVGGGARVTNSANNSTGVNALLTSEYPKDDGNFATFVADSKDHVQASTHRLWVYAIGMKLYNNNGEGIDPLIVKSNMNLSKSVSSLSSYPTASVCPPSGYTLLSGGAKVNWTGAGNLLTKSTLSGNCWQVASKDHGIYSPATIEAYALSFVTNGLPEFGTLLITTKFGAVNTSAYNQGNVTINTYDASTFQNWLLTGVGTNAVSSGNGRLLFELYPVNPNLASSRDKDHLYPASGTLNGSIIMVRRQP